MIISIAIQKGGSGKTTTTINLAAALQLLGHKVLVIDMDPQANLTQAMGLEDDIEPNIYHVLKEEANGKSTGLNTIIHSETKLNLIPAGLALSGAELELVSVYGREHILAGLLEPLKKAYDFIFIDCPPSMGMLTVNALVASDYVLLPLQAEYLPFKGVNSFLNHFQKIKRSLNRNLEVLGLLLTKFDPRKKMNQHTAQQLETLYKGQVFEAKIRVNIALAEAQEKGIDIFSYNESSNGAWDYLQLAQEFLKRTET